MGDFAGGITARLSSNLVAVFLAQGVGLVIATGLLLLSGEARPGEDALIYAALAGIAGAFGLFCFYLALSRGTMGLVAPLTALLSAAWPATFALIRDGSGDLMTLIGMGVALASVVLIAVPDRRMGTPVMPTYRGSRSRELLLVIGASLGFGSFFLFIGASHDAGGAVWWPLFMVKLAGVSAVVAIGLLMLPLGRLPALAVGAATLMMGAIAGVGDLGGNLFFVLASDEGDLAVVIVLTSLYPVVTAILARIFLHERLSPLRVLGVAAAIVGVVIIGLAGSDG